MADAISCALILVTMGLKPGRTSGMNSRVWRLLLVFVAFTGLIGFSRIGLAQSTDPVVAEVASPLPLESDGVGEYLIARPSEPNGTLFVFYPGGKVPARAYEFWARALAAQGVTVAIPIMPLDLAILGIYRASAVRDALLAKGWRAKRFVVGGHSLGGAMAGWYSSWLPVDGLVFMAAYPPWSIAEKKFPVLSIAAELDGLATLEKVLSSLPNLPPTAQLEVIPGGVHAFFGRYGVQDRDGQPTTSREVFEAAVLEKLSVFFESIRP
jgi:pimeloyl-ACP methyl ester carboxylesterase